MYEIEIQIDCLRRKKQCIQIEISKPFAYGRSPDDKEFLTLVPLLSELIKVQAKINILEQTLDDINSNIRPT